MYIGKYGTVYNLKNTISIDVVNRKVLVASKYI